MNPDYATSEPMEEWTGTDRPQGPMVGRVKGLEKSIMVLSESVGRLEDRLQPALRPSTPRLEAKDQNISAIPAATSELLASLNQVGRDIEHITKRLEEVSERVEL